MKILIAGAGKVGSTVARQLSSESHDLTLIDSKQEVLDHALARFDVTSSSPPPARTRSTSSAASAPTG